MNNDNRLLSRRALAALSIGMLAQIGNTRASAQVLPDLATDSGMAAGRRCWWVWRNGRRVRICRFGLSE